MLQKLFLSHPRDVNESYGEHLMVAGRFGVTMIAGGVAALIHGLVPGLFVRTGSATVKRLEQQMRARQPGARAAWDQQGWVPDYEI